MRLTQIQTEVINAAHLEGKVAPASFGRVLSHHPDDVDEAISDLVDQGLVAAADGNTFCLTDQGEAVYRRQKEANRAAVLRRTGSWQPR